MAGNEKLKVLRGTSTQRAAQGAGVVLSAGQPFFETDTGKFYVGTGAAIKDATPVKATPIAHSHAASEITSGTLSSDRLPTVPLTKGGTGATTAAGALTNLGITATAAELNFVDGVTSNIQTQLGNKAPTSHASSSTTYGAGTTTNYGHVKLQTGDMNGTSSTNGIAAGLGHTHSNYALTGHTHTEFGGLVLPKKFYDSTGTSKLGNSSSTAVTVFTDASAVNYKTYMVTIALDSYYNEVTGLLLLGNYMDDKWGGRVQFNFVQTYNSGSTSPIIGRTALFCTLDKTTGEFKAYVNEGASSTYGTYSYKLKSSGGFDALGYDTASDFQVKITGVVGLC